MGSSRSGYRRAEANAARFQQQSLAMMARASAAASRAAREANAIMKEALAVQAKQLEEANRIAGEQLKIAQEMLGMSRNRYQHWEKYFKPLEIRVARDAEVGIDPNQNAARARTDVQSQFDESMGQTQRNLQRMGIDPSSGRYVSGVRDIAIARAAATAGVMNQARTQANQVNWDRRVQAAAIGAGIPGEVMQAFGAAGDITGRAAQTVTQAGEAYGQVGYGAAQVMNQGGQNVSQVRMAGANMLAGFSQFEAQRADYLRANHRSGLETGLMLGGMVLGGGIGLAAGGGWAGIGMGAMMGSQFGAGMGSYFG